MEEFQVMSEINANIQKHNNGLKESRQLGTKSFKRKKISEQVWKYKELSKKGNSIDQKLYWDKILELLLYPYYKEIQRKYPNIEVKLIENNIKRYFKAIQVVETEYKEKDIWKVTHSPNSLNFNIIKGLQDYKKNCIDKYSVEEDI